MVAPLEGKAVHLVIDEESAGGLALGIVPKPRFQRSVELLGYGMAGLIAFGTVLDAIANSVTLISPTVAIVLSILIGAAWITFEVWVRVHGLVWQTSQGIVLNLKSLGIKPRLAVSGVIALLWVPQLLDLAGIGGKPLDPSARRLLGVLGASRAATRDAIRSVESMSQIARYEMKQPSSSPEDAPNRGTPLMLPNILATIQTDGDLHQALSPPMRSPAGIRQLPACSRIGVRCNHQSQGEYRTSPAAASGVEDPICLNYPRGAVAAGPNCSPRA